MTMTTTMAFNEHVLCTRNFSKCIATKCIALHNSPIPNCSNAFPREASYKYIPE